MFRDSTVDFKRKGSKKRFQEKVGSLSNIQPGNVAQSNLSNVPFDVQQYHNQSLHIFQKIPKFLPSSSRHEGMVHSPKGTSTSAYTCIYDQANHVINPKEYDQLRYSNLSVCSTNTTPIRRRDDQGLIPPFHPAFIQAEQFCPYDYTVNLKPNLTSGQYIEGHLPPPIEPPLQSRLTTLNHHQAYMSPSHDLTADSISLTPYDTLSHYHSQFAPIALPQPQHPCLISQNFHPVQELIINNLQVQLTEQPQLPVHHFPGHLNFTQILFEQQDQFQKYSTFHQTQQDIKHTHQNIECHQHDKKQAMNHLNYGAEQWQDRRRQLPDQSQQLCKHSEPMQQNHQPQANRKHIQQTCTSEHKADHDAAFSQTNLLDISRTTYDSTVTRIQPKSISLTDTQVYNSHSTMNQCPKQSKNNTSSTNNASSSENPVTASEMTDNCENIDVCFSSKCPIAVNASQNSLIVSCSCEDGDSKSEKSNSDANVCKTARKVHEKESFVNSTNSARPVTPDSGYSDSPNQSERCTQADVRSEDIIDSFGCNLRIHNCSADIENLTTNSMSKDVAINSQFPVSAGMFSEYRDSQSQHKPVEQDGLPQTRRESTTTKKRYASYHRVDNSKTQSVPQLLASPAHKARLRWLLKEAGRCKQSLPLALRPKYDPRTCLLCGGKGDAESRAGGRLVNISLDKWVHLNCILWSAGVTLHKRQRFWKLCNVANVIRRGRKSKCSVCRRIGATIGCHVKNCSANVHFPCALRHGFVFFEDDNSVLCPHHLHLGQACKQVDDFRLAQCILVERDEMAAYDKFFDAKDGFLRIGSLTISRLGTIIPNGEFHTTTRLFPLSFSATRICSWRKVNVQQSLKANNSAAAADGTTVVSKKGLRLLSSKIIRVHSLLEIRLSKYDCLPRFSVSVYNHKKNILFAIEEARPEAALATFLTAAAVRPTQFVCREGIKSKTSHPVTSLYAGAKCNNDLRITSCAVDIPFTASWWFGLEEPISYLLEFLPGASQCREYCEHKLLSSYNPLEMVEPRSSAPYLTSRLMPVLRRHDQNLRRLIAVARKDMPAALHRTKSKPKQSRVNESQEMMDRISVYRLEEKLKSVAANVHKRVIVGSSLIAGRGLFCVTDFEAGELVVEYAGELLRSHVADIREELYKQRGLGCYMFGLEEGDQIIDATLKGNVARFINHSCDPNCCSQEVQVDGRRRIVIFARRNICAGEELTYDYKHQLDDNDKAPCLCSAINCRAWVDLPPLCK